MRSVPNASADAARAGFRPGRVLPGRVRPGRVLPACALLAAIVVACGGPASEAEPFDVVEATIPEMRAAMEGGQVTSRQIVMEHLARIARYEWQLNAAVSVNPNALAEAEALDAERAAGNVRGRCTASPVALKDNIHTTHLPTTGGLARLRGYFPPYEATLTTNLREAGAIIIAKAGLTEFANFMAGPPNPDAGQLQRPHGLRPQPLRSAPRPPGRPQRRASGALDGGLQFGDGTAASFWSANVGQTPAGPSSVPRTRTCSSASGRRSRASVAGAWPR